MSSDDRRGYQPPPVEIEHLRSHFRNIYGLSEAQVEEMVIRSAQSLKTTLDQLHNSLEREVDLQQVHHLSHNLKGVLLNMGETGWADLARRMEKSAVAGGSEDYLEIVVIISKGMHKIVELAES